MRQVKRYTTNVGYGHEEHDGEFVLWDDYAALAAEVEVLRMNRWKVSVGNGQHVFVGTADEALLLGKRFAEIDMLRKSRNDSNPV